MYSSSVVVNKLTFLKLIIIMKNYNEEYNHQINQNDNNC